MPNGHAIQYTMESLRYETLEKHHIWIEGYIFSVIFLSQHKVYEKFKLRLRTQNVYAHKINVFGLKVV